MNQIWTPIEQRACVSFARDRFCFAIASGNSFALIGP
jgi:hypothetical protein